MNEGDDPEWDLRGTTTTGYVDLQGMVVACFSLLYVLDLTITPLSSPSKVNSLNACWTEVKGIGCCGPLLYLLVGKPVQLLVTSTCHCLGCKPEELDQKS